MKCNICGSESDSGERICKYCGNELAVFDEQEIVKKSKPDELSKTINEMPPAADESETGERRVYIPKSELKRKYCNKCGRPLDGITNKCVVCEAGEVGRYGYSRNITKENSEEFDMASSRKRKHKKNPNRIIFVLVMIVVMVVLFMASFLIFFNLLGGKWGSDETETDGPQMTAEATATVQPARTPEVVITNDVTAAPSEEPTDKPTEQPQVTEPPQNKPEEVLNYYGGEYLYPSYEKVISDSELSAKDRQSIKLIFHEIYARYGYTFEDDDLVEYFESQSWYMPTTTDINGVESKFNQYEKENIEKIKEYQKKMGWRQ